MLNATVGTHNDNDNDIDNDIDNDNDIDKDEYKDYVNDNTNKHQLLIPFIESNSALTENDTEIVGQGISMLVEIMTTEPKLWPAFYNYKGIKKWLFLLVLKSPDLKVREYAATGVVRLVQRARRLYVTTASNYISHSYNK